MNTRPISIILQERHEQRGGGWEVIAVYQDEEQETLANFSPFLNNKLVRELAGLIARSQGLDSFEQDHE